MRVAATGAIELTKIFDFAPSIASVLEITISFPINEKFNNSKNSLHLNIKFEVSLPQFQEFVV